jgi:hypothetical protein
LQAAEDTAEKAKEITDKTVQKTKDTAAETYMKKIPTFFLKKTLFNSKSFCNFGKEIVKLLHSIKIC